MCGSLSRGPTGDVAHNPGMCPDWETNLQPSGLQAGAQSTEPHQPGLNIYFNYFIVVQVQLSPCSCHHFPHPIHHCLPPSIFPHFGFVHVSFIIVPVNPFPHYPLPSPLWSLSACSQFQSHLLYFAFLFILLIRFLLMLFVFHCLAYFT